MKLAFREATTDERRCSCRGHPSDSDRCSLVVPLISRAYKSAHTAGLIQMEDWAAIMHLQITKMLARPNVRTILAVEATDQNFVYGFIAGDTSRGVPVVYFVYVKEPYRKEGIARGLFGELGVDPRRKFIYVAKTGVVAEIARANKIPFAQFNNNEARYPTEPRRET